MTEVSKAKWFPAKHFSAPGGRTRITDAQGKKQVIDNARIVHRPEGKFLKEKTVYLAPDRTKQRSKWNRKKVSPQQRVPKVLTSKFGRGKNPDASYPLAEPVQRTTKKVVVGGGLTDTGRNTVIGTGAAGAIGTYLATDQKRIDRVKERTSSAAASTKNAFRAGTTKARVGAESTKEHFREKFGKSAFGIEHE